MVTVNISDETFDFLKDFVNRLNTQNDRSTASPYVYVVRDTHKVYGIDSEYDSTGRVWYNSNESSSYETDEGLLDDLGIGDGACVEDVASRNGYEFISYKDVRVIKNVFFTEKSAIEHIKTCHYHYDDPDIYVEFLARNTEMSTILSAIEEVVGAESDS